jgi:hypothetical protein
LQGNVIYTSFACCASNSVIFHSYEFFFTLTLHCMCNVFCKMLDMKCTLTCLILPKDCSHAEDQNYNLVYVLFNVPCDKSVPFTMAWRVLRLWMEERPPIWKVAATILNKLQTVDRGWSSSLGVGQGANNSSPLKYILLQNIHRQSLGPGMILWYDISNKRGT